MTVRPNEEARDDRSAGSGRELFARWHALIERGDSRFRLVSTLEEAAEPIARFAAKTRSSVWNMQRHSTIHDLRDVDGLDSDSRRRGHDLRYILPRRVAERRNPLVSSHCSYLRLAPVAQPLLISDRRRILFGDASGETIWTSDDPEVVTDAVGLYERIWAAAVPAVPDGEDPPFSTRMIEVALLLVDGASDREIARSLGVSERTVSAEVREMSRRLGARSRAHAIALISGVEG